MFDLIDRLERQGQAGAPTALGIGLLLALIALGVLATTVFGGEGTSRWTAIFGGGFSFLTTGLAMMFTMVGVRLRTGRVYPDPADVFPSIPAADFREVVYQAERPLAACSECLIHLPAAFSTGACPRCESSINWHRIETDEDAELVCSAIAD